MSLVFSRHRIVPSRPEAAVKAEAAAPTTSSSALRKLAAAEEDRRSPAAFLKQPLSRRHAGQFRTKTQLREFLSWIRIGDRRHSILKASKAKLALDQGWEQHTTIPDKLNERRAVAEE